MLPTPLATLTLPQALDLRLHRLLTLQHQAPPQACQWQEPPFTRQSSRYPFSMATVTATHTGAKPSPWSSDIKDYGMWLTVHPPLLTPLWTLRPILIGVDATKRPTSNSFSHSALLHTTICSMRHHPRRYGTCSKPGIKAVGNSDHITSLRGYSQHHLLTPSPWSPKSTTSSPSRAS